MIVYEWFRKMYRVVSAEMSKINTLKVCTYILRSENDLHCSLSMYAYMTEHAAHGKDYI